MKQTIRTTIACCAALLSFAACENTDDLSGGGQGSGAILINLSPGEMTRGEMTRAEAGMFDFEKRVDHLDVLIFEDTDDPKTNVKKWHERILTGGSTTGEGTVTLKAGRKDFEANRKYRVYVIANASDEEKARFEDGGFTKSQLLGMQRTNNYIHLTGMPNNNSSGITLPQTFLMDGAAYAGATEPTTSEGAPMATAVVLNDGVAQNDTQLKVTLRRAAAKLVLKLIPGTDETGKSIIKFLDPGTDSGAASETQNITGGYYLRNMPYTTSLLAEQPLASEAVLARTPRQTRNHYFDLHSTGPDPDDPTKRYIDYITVTAYAYARSWAEGSTLTREPRWIVDIPLEYNTGTGDRETVTYTASYYQIPVCRGQQIERNTCYTVQATISAPGGTDPSVPVNLTDLAYEVEHWEETKIPIGGDGDRPKFLTVNRTEMEMRNIATDNTTLQFVSSSEVTATIKKVYYIDKFGQEVQLEEKFPDNPDDNTWGVKTETPGTSSEPTITWSSEYQISIVPDKGFNGNIKIYSEVPRNNTARYITVEVTNGEDRITRTVNIIQYPLINITNIQGWYSYRSDFGGTTWENYLNPTEKRVSAYGYIYDPDKATGTWKYSATEDGGNMRLWKETRDRWNRLTAVKWTQYGDPIFFTSLVAQDLTTPGNEGKSDIFRYCYETHTDDFRNWWDSEKKEWKPDPSKGLKTNVKLFPSGNARMYHVEVTATSKEYTIGRPRITNGKTDPGADNAKLVSPSFMTASQLGAVPVTAFDSFNKTDKNDENYAVEYKKAQAMAASHCEQYVEVTKDGTVYGDWRLPTAAEIGIIIDLQYNTADGAAMDVVMAGSNYFSASGLVTNESSTFDKSLHFLRCVRDEYKQATGKETDPAAGNQ